MCNCEQGVAPRSQIDMRILYHPMTLSDPMIFYKGCCDKYLCSCAKCTQIEKVKVFSLCLLVTYSPLDADLIRLVGNP